MMNKVVPSTDCFESGVGVNIQPKREQQEVNDEIRQGLNYLNQPQPTIPQHKPLPTAQTVDYNLDNKPASKPPPENSDGGNPHSDSHHGGSEGNKQPQTTLNWGERLKLIVDEADSRIKAAMGIFLAIWIIVQITLNAIDNCRNSPQTHQMTNGILCINYCIGAFLLGVLIFIIISISCKDRAKRKTK